jgi:hypothetical protein
MRNRFFVAALLSALTACSSNPAPEGEPMTPEPAGASRSDVITTAELDEPSIASINMYDAIRRLRPRFLMTRGQVSPRNPTAGSTKVSVDGGPLVGIEILGRIQPSEIAEVRWLSASDAAQRFGINAASGAVIILKTR